jgi:2-polyprenyl-3-methyl-5-hydroxy-6-metoxy-1,4-benzoquinol methylase
VRLRLPSEEELNTATARALRQWDLREYFAVDARYYWPIHYRNRLETILQALSDLVPPGGSVLDIGCAQATASILLAERGFKVTAAEANPESIEYAKLRVEFGKISFICTDATRLSLRERFDAILLGEVLEHVPRPGALVQSCHAMLHRGGVMVITTPNGLSPHNWLLPSYDFAKMELPDRANRPSGLGGRETHLFCLRPSQLRNLVRASGLVIERYRLLNSYVINPLGLHRILPLSAAERLNRWFSQIPMLAAVTTMTQFLVARKP